MKKAIIQLRKWMINATWGGLETWSSHEHESAREKDQRTLTRLILKTQRDYNILQHRSESETRVDDALSKKLSKVSEEHSRQARLFAFALASADSAEVGIQLYPTKSNNGVMSKILSFVKKKKS